MELEQCQETTPQLGKLIMLLKMESLITFIQISLKCVTITVFMMMCWGQGLLCHDTHVKVRGQLRVNFLPFQTQVIRLAQQTPLSVDHLTFWETSDSQRKQTVGGAHAEQSLMTLSLF